MWSKVLLWSIIDLFVVGANVVESTFVVGKMWSKVLLWSIIDLFVVEIHVVESTFVVEIRCLKS